jgi:hypothetical protein
MEVMDHGGDGPPLGGVYNFTVAASYGANQSLRAAIPDITVRPGVITYVIVSVPSGRVTTTACAWSSTTPAHSGNSCTATTATVSGKGS